MRNTERNLSDYFKIISTFIFPNLYLHSLLWSYGTVHTQAISFFFAFPFTVKLLERVTDCTYFFFHVHISLFFVVWFLLPPPSKSYALQNYSNHQWPTSAFSLVPIFLIFLYHCMLLTTPSRNSTTWLFYCFSYISLCPSYISLFSGFFFLWPYLLPLCSFPPLFVCFLFLFLVFYK